MPIVFQNPMMFWGISAIAIPIIIHLFTFRKLKIVYFSNTDLLRRLQKETVSHTKLKHYLILASRIFAIIALVLAFTMPFIPAKNSSIFNKSKQIVAVYIDNSFSMSNEGRDGLLIEDAKKRALSIVNAHSAETQFIIQDNNNTVANHFLLSKEKAIEVIKAISTTAISLPISSVHNSIKTIAQNNASGVAVNQYFISDFQKSMFDVAMCKPDSMYRWTWIPLQSQTIKNISIDSCWFETPSRLYQHTDKLFVKISNTSNNSYDNIPVSLFLNDTIKALSNIKLKPNESEIVELEFLNSFKGIIKGKIEITDYPILFDNTYYFSYQIQEKFNVLVIQSATKNKYLDALLVNDESLSTDFINYNAVNYSLLAQYNTVILSGIPDISDGLSSELQKTLLLGNSVILFTDKGISLQGYNTFLQACKAPLLVASDTVKVKTQAIDYKHPVFTNVFKSEIGNADLPYIFFHYKTAIPSQSATQRIMWANNGDMIAGSTQVNKAGNLYLITTPCNNEANNLIKHPIFVPLLLKIISNSTATGTIQYKIGNSQNISVKAQSNDKSLLTLSNDKGKGEFIPQQISENNGLTKINTQQSITEAGHYNIIAASKPISTIAFNYDRKESTMEFYDTDKIIELANQNLGNTELLSSSKDLTGDSIKKLSAGTQLWKWFVLACLAFILIEILLIRFYKK